jgi:hypothetical protein
MSVLQIGGQAAFHVTSNQGPNTKQQQQSASPVTTSTSTPAATVEISPQALAAAAAAKGTPAAGAQAPTAPKLNNAKLANKEANEPLLLLTKQAKHGDVVAKLILKQLAKKEAAHQSQGGRPNAPSNVADDEGEAAPSHEGSASVGSSGHSGEEESAGPAEASESGDSGNQGEHQETGQHS